MLGKIVFTIRLLIIFAGSSFILNTMSYAPYMHMNFENGFYSAGLFVFIYLLFFTLALLGTMMLYSKFDFFSKFYARLVFSLLICSAGVFLINYFITFATFPLWIKVLMALQLAVNMVEDPNPFRHLRGKLKG